MNHQPPADPAIYKIIALLQIAVWGSFFIRYVRVLFRNGTLHRPRWHDLKIALNSQSLFAKFAGAVLMIGVAMVFYGLTTVLRQFLGADYWGRDAVRVASSTLILASGLIFHRVLSRTRKADRPMRRSTDLP